MAGWLDDSVNAQAASFLGWSVVALDEISVTTVCDLQNNGGLKEQRRIKTKRRERMRKH